MKTKNIKVVYTNRYSHGTVPKIQMEGKWLEELGFTIGTALIVEYEENSIRIRPLTSREQKAQEIHLLKSEYKRKGNELKELEASLSMVAESMSGYSSPSQR